MKYRKHGFTQRKPHESGVYFVSTETNLDGPVNEREGWTVALVYFQGGFHRWEHNATNAHWRIQALNGLDYAWNKGMWIKGPVEPDGYRF